ncbi:putative regulatory protein [Klebsiella aerogenes]|nr:putative regulatory protein [Klebsiella aerogenes]
MVYHTALKQAKFADEDRLIPDSMAAWRVWRFKQGELMTYQQAGRIAVIKRILGWVIFIPAVLSTLISVLKFMYEHSEKKPGIDAVMMDFAHLMIEMVRFNTPFLNFFWYNSPLPEFKHALNIGFWIVYALVFVGMALQASGARMGRQAKFLREGVEDQLILEQAKGAEGLSREQLAERIVVPRHTILKQYFTLYVLPIVVIVIGYVFFSLLGFL